MQELCEWEFVSSLIDVTDMVKDHPRDSAQGDPIDSIIDSRLMHF